MFIYTTNKKRNVYANLCFKNKNSQQHIDLYDSR